MGISGRCSFPVCIAVLFLIGTQITVAQTDRPSAAPTSTPAVAPVVPPAPSSPQNKPTITSFAGKLASNIVLFGDKGDYIPCEFSRVALLNLRPEPAILTLTSSDEEALRSQIIAEASDKNNADAFPPGKRDAFIRHIAEASFVGLTPSQATGKALYLLALDTAPSAEARNLLAAASKSNKTFADYLATHYQIPSNTAMNKLTPAEQPPQVKVAIASVLAEHTLTAAQPQEKNLWEAARSNSQDLSAYVSKTFNLDVRSSLAQAQQSTESRLDALSIAVKSQPNVEQAVTKAKELGPAANLQNVAAESQQVLASVPAKNNVAQAAQQQTAAIVRPTDIACSMSLLSYDTTRYAFGQRMADEFIPVQIIVRNLNPTKEFLVHDVEFAVDEDINGRFGRYASGVDKLTARTFMLTARDYD